MPCTKATWESTQTTATVDLDHLTTYGNHDVEAKERNKMQIKRLTTQYKNISKKEEGSGNFAPPTPYI